MNIEIKGIHLEVTEAMRAYIEKKMTRLDFAREYVVDMLFTISKEGSSFKIEVMINFRWGNPTHVGLEDFDIFKPSALVSFFNREIVKRDLIEPDYYKMFVNAHECYQAAEFDAYIDINPKTAGYILEIAQRFVERMERYLMENGWL